MSEKQETPPVSGPPDPLAGPLAEVDDKQLVARAREKDPDAYDELVRRHYPRIYGLVYNMTSNREDAEDLVQEVFLKAYTALERFQGKSSFYTWIYRIALNRTINFVKKRRRRRAMSLDDMDAGLERDELYQELSSRHTPHRDSRITELKEKLNDALQKLSEKHRSVVVMHDIQGMPHDEIGKILKVSSGTVRSRLFYARRLLQSELAEFSNEL